MHFIVLNYFVFVFIFSKFKYFVFKHNHDSYKSYKHETLVETLSMWKFRVGGGVLDIVNLFQKFLNIFLKYLNHFPKFIPKINYFLNRNIVTHPMVGLNPIGLVMIF